MVWVIEVRGREGGSSLDSGGAGGLPEKECLFLDFFYFPATGAGLGRVSRASRYKERYKVGQSRQVKR